MEGEILNWADEGAGMMLLSSEGVFMFAGGRDPKGLGRALVVDEFGKVFVSDSDIERIAQWVAELLKPQLNRTRGL